MRTFTTTHTVYNFDELTEDQKQKAIEKLSDINVDYEWWDSIYEDAAEIGLAITSFDIYRGEIHGALTESMAQVIKDIFKQHGNACATWRIAELYKNKHGEDNEQKFTDELLHEYLSMLSEDYDYQTSEAAIIETIQANEYEFNADGSIA